ncbi:GFA family protein [Chenggangzhangella methanolivorans]|uniref:GFA family protein n=1 Tax=Chenggangzhangella methanolivorans TaxID=1437009 RepID=A0A9E6UHA4_9HYPH|nr:GFA family protein [Chenggangzhangella methanolivorans]QZN99582.1 GFA family protein [Chenggangzhangella methanolivorans]
MSREGGCLCGGVTYRISGDLKAPLACHCSQCARTSGNYAAMAACRTDELTIADDGTLSWFQSSPEVRRGFRARCGGNLFWRQDPGDETYVTVGTLTPPTGLRLAEHIFVASRSDFYDIADGLPQKPQW